MVIVLSALGGPKRIEPRVPQSLTNGCKLRLGRRFLAFLFSLVQALAGQAKGLVLERTEPHRSHSSAEEAPEVWRLGLLGLACLGQVGARSDLLPHRVLDLLIDVAEDLSTLTTGGSLGLTAGPLSAHVLEQ